MPDAIYLAKAELRELETVDTGIEKLDGQRMVVQFNPETLNVTFANQIIQPGCAGDQSGTATRQFVGAGTTRLSVTLWFDVNAPQTGGILPEYDVRKLTRKVVYFITPQDQTNEEGAKPKKIPPAVRFLWGSFQFDGIMDSLTESLEFFSSAGIPLRASVAFSLSQQKIHLVTNDLNGLFAGGGPLGASVGTTPLVQAPGGVPLQKITDRLGPGVSWQRVAAANNIENPRILKTKQPIKITNI